MKPPRWTKEEEVLKLVKRRLQELRDEVWHFDPNSNWGQVLVYRDRRMDPVAPLPTKAHELMRKLVLAEIKREETALWGSSGERAAVAAALRGNLRPLASLLPTDKLPKEINPATTIKQLKWETWELISEFLLGERNLKTGKKKGERGRRRKSPEERRKHSPTHDAAELVPIILEILLRSEYGRQKGMRDRAIEIAAKIKGVARKTLANYFKRSQTDRRRRI